MTKYCREMDKELVSQPNPRLSRARQGFGPKSDPGIESEERNKTRLQIDTQAESSLHHCRMCPDKAGFLFRSV